ncbi:hypothetical protein KFE25_002941 [Diacronema lutheri]|uniref:Uncharacterized protein n=3 Tax=Diacronema lutheri TaxID=2081491 RepID=A0A8J5XSA8_DIALT|nr:hypothetical protein KFE25_002941 [Diacronema lutheri]
MLRLVVAASVAVCAAHARSAQLGCARLAPAPRASVASAPGAPARHTALLAGRRAPPAQPRGRALLAIRDEARAAAAVGDEIEPDDAYRAALVKTALIAAAAAAFGAGMWYVRGKELAFQFFAGYVIEESLSIDNLFVFKLIFDFFAVTGAAQKKCLSWGIWAAAIFRLVMITLGVEAVEAFRPVLLLFAAILLLSSGTILVESFSGEKEPPDLANNAVVKLCSSIVPTTDAMDGDRFWTVAADGVRRATPLLVALACIEVSDVVFAVDSVPAVLGVTSDPFVAFTSNMFAILGLRALFSVLATLVSDFEYLQPAVALVLGFVGSKMVAEFFGHEVSISTSLGAIVLILAAGVGLSILLPAEVLPGDDGDEK